MLRYVEVRREARCISQAWKHFPVTCSEEGLEAELRGGGGEGGVVFLICCFVIYFLILLSVRRRMKSETMNYLHYSVNITNCVRLRNKLFFKANVFQP